MSFLLSFSLAVFPNESEHFISTSEDRTIRIWKGKEDYQRQRVGIVRVDQ